MSERGQSSDPYITVLLHTYAAKFIYSVDTYKLFAGPSSFSDLNQYVRASGYDLRFRMFSEQPDCIFYITSLI